MVWQLIIINKLLKIFSSQYYMKKIFIILISLAFITACDNNDVSYETEENTISGTGAFIFNDYQPLATKPLNVFYHVPQNVTSNTKILFVFHGSGRNAAEYRDAWISKANEYGVIIVAPEFSDNYFPGGDSYNLGNVFMDGNHPSASTLTNESQWTFSLIEPLFNKIKSLTDNNSSKYDIYGHSAGAQFTHRFLLFKPNAHVDKVIASAAGWYTLPDETVDFPYGLNNSFTDFNLNNFFNQNLIIQIGELDNDPNSPALRHNTTVDQQGDNRYDRAYYFFNLSETIAQQSNSSFNWQIIETPNTAHEFGPTINQAAEVLFE